MWLLGRLLPIMVGDKVPVGDDQWLNYLDLLTIVDLILAPELSEDDIALLSVLITDHHHEFVKLPQSHLKCIISHTCQGSFLSKLKYLIVVYLRL